LCGLGGLARHWLLSLRLFGAEVTMLSHSPSKEADAKIRCTLFYFNSDPEVMKSLAGEFDVILILFQQIMIIMSI
jgi:uncharacterized zinc-type alcohol dehydrogenase-like protein